MRVLGTVAEIDSGTVDDNTIDCDSSGRAAGVDADIDAEVDGGGLQLLVKASTRIDITCSKGPGGEPDVDKTKGPVV